MPKKLITIMIAIAALVGLSGCAQKAAQKDFPAGTDGRREFGRPDFGQPDRRPDITGLVKSVTGNEATILKIERPQRPEGQNDENDGSKNSGGNESQNPAPSLGAGPQRMPGGGPGNWRGRDQNRSAESESAMLERFKQMSSGEVTVTIPVGIKMLKPDASQSGTDNKPQMSEATLADLAKDKMVSIWLVGTASSTDSDKTASSTQGGEKKQAEFVMINR